MRLLFALEGFDRCSPLSALLPFEGESVELPLVDDIVVGARTAAVPLDGRGGGGGWGWGCGWAGRRDAVVLVGEALVVRRRSCGRAPWRARGVRVCVVSVVRGVGRRRRRGRRHGAQARAASESARGSVRLVGSTWLYCADSRAQWGDTGRGDESLGRTRTATQTLEMSAETRTTAAAGADVAVCACAGVLVCQF